MAITGKPCPRCLALAKANRLTYDMVLPIPEGLGLAPMARDGSGKCCRDCAAADGLLRVMTGIPGWEAARVVIGNDRREYMRGNPVTIARQLGLLHQFPGPADMMDYFDWVAPFANFERLELDRAWARWAEQVDAHRDEKGHVKKWSAKGWRSLDEEVLLSPYPPGWTGHRDE